MKSYIFLVVLNASVLLNFLNLDVLFNSQTDHIVRYNLPAENAIATVSRDIKPFEVFYTPTVDDSFVGFKEAIAFKESRGKYHIVNSLGYMGKYQFGKTTLKHFNIDKNEFLKNPELQEKAFRALCERNKWRLRNEIKNSVGKKINGIEITESGILAAAHLAGSGNVKRYLRSNGRIVFSDAYGSNIQYYMKKFSGYDTSFINPEENPTI
jgi:hypothetical protein